MGLLVLGLLGAEDRLVYFPTRTLTSTPADYGMAFETVRFSSEDAYKLMGWIIPGDGETWLLYFHGNGQNVSSYLSLMAELHTLGLNLLLFDYRGYGESEGSPSEAGLYADAHAAYALLMAYGVPPERLFLYGFSLGSGVAVQLATEVEVAGLVLEAAFTSLPAAGRARYPMLPTALMRNRYDSLSKIARIDAPLLVLHARDDRTVPFSQGQALYAEATVPKTFAALTGGHVAMLRRPADSEGLAAVAPFVGAE